MSTTNIAPQFRGKYENGISLNDLNCGDIFGLEGGFYMLHAVQRRKENNWHVWLITKDGLLHTRVSCDDMMIQVDNISLAECDDIARIDERQ